MSPDSGACCRSGTTDNTKSLALGAAAYTVRRGCLSLSSHLPAGQINPGGAELGQDDERSPAHPERSRLLA